MAKSMCHISVFMMFMYVILGSAGKRDVEETPEEALFYTDHISPLLEKLYVSGKSKFCYFILTSLFLSHRDDCLYSCLICLLS